MKTAMFIHTFLLVLNVSRVYLAHPSWRNILMIFMFLINMRLFKCTFYSLGRYVPFCYTNDLILNYNSINFIGLNETLYLYSILWRCMSSLMRITIYKHGIANRWREMNQYSNFLKKYFICCILSVLYFLMKKQYFAD